ncbi:MAG: hypothetical protein Q9O74_11490 [Planctomycetota bacterium]|nr:hypothetical protein [Planctomycetota bacterium]
MLKAIRKYNKLILGVGGTLLLIAFLMPQAIQQLGQASKGKAVGTMGGHKITLAEHDRATRELKAVEDFYSELSAFGVGYPLGGLNRDEKVAHWMLLTHEAEQAGMVGGADEGAQLLPLFAQQIVQNSFQQLFGSQANRYMQTNPEEVRTREAEALQFLGRIKLQVANQARLMETEFDQTLAKLQGVLRMLNAYRYAERLSDSQTMLIAQRLGDSVIVDAAMLSARRLIDETIEPTPEQLREHFDRFRELRIGEGEFGIGYKLPPRVKVEWLELSPRAISNVLTVSLIEATKLWQQNRDRFPGEFDAEREKIDSELKNAELAKVMGTAESVIRSAILSAVRTLEIEGDGTYRVLPDDWASRKPDFLKIADQVVATVQEAHGLTIPTPAVYVRDGSWLDGGMLSKQPGIGAATVRFGRQTAEFPGLVMAVRELAGDSILGLQVGVPSTDLVLESPDRSRYYFTVLDAAAESVPDSPDDLLDPERLTADWLALQRYRELTNRTDEFAALVEAEGMTAFAESFGEYVPKSNIVGYEPEPQPRVTVSTRARITSEGTSGLRGLDNNETVIREVLARTATIDPLSPIEDVPLPDRIVDVQVPEVLTVLVTQIQRIEPLTRELMPVFVRYAQQEHIRETFPTGMPIPYRYDILKRRHGFSLNDRDDEDAASTVDAAADADADADETPANEGDATTEDGSSQDD